MTVVQHSLHMNIIVILYNRHVLLRVDDRIQIDAVLEDIDRGMNAPTTFLPS